MKKFISALTLFSLALTTACGSTSTVSSDTTVADSNDTSTETVVSEYKKPNVDLGGKTFTIATHNMEMAYVIAKYNMISHNEENGDVLNDAIVQMTRKVEEELNVKLDMYEIDQNDRLKSDRYTQSIYAGDDVYQIATPFTAVLTLLLAEPDLLIDLNDVPTLDLTHSWWDQKSIEEYNIGGKQYTAVGDICFYMKCSPVVNFFNKEMVESLKLGNLYQLVYDGNWTMDALIKLARTAANDVNGNQNIDYEEDRFGFVCEDSSLRYLLLGAGVDYSQRNGDDITMTFLGERSIAVIEKMVPFIREAATTLYAGDLYSKYSSPFTELFMPAFMGNRALFYSNQLLQALDFRSMNADFGILPLPKLDEKQPEYINTTNAAWRDNVVIPATNTDLEATGYILDAMGYYSQQLVTPAFIDATILGKSVRDEDSANMIQLIYDTQVYDIAYIFNWGGMNAMLQNLLRATDTGLASAYASIEATLKSNMEKTMTQLLGE